MKSSTLKSRPKVRLAQGRIPDLLKRLSRSASRAAVTAALGGSFAVTALAALFGFNPQAFAATDTWGAAPTNANFAPAANWTYSAGTGPVATGDALVFGASSVTSATDNLMTPQTFTIIGVTFNAGAPAYTINQGTVGTSGFTLTGGLNNASTNLQTIKDIITLNTVQNFTVTAGGGNTTITSAVNGAGGITVADTAPTALSGTLTLSNADYTGATSVNNGTTLTITGGAFGSTSSVINVGGVTTANIGSNLNLFGANVNASTVSIGEASNENASNLTITGGIINFTATADGGNPAAGAAGIGGAGGASNNGGEIDITGGTVHLGSTYIGRGTGMVINGAGASVTSALLNVTSNAGSSHPSEFQMENGTYTIGSGTSLAGAFEVGSTVNDGPNTLLMTGGTLTYSGSDGVQLGSESFMTISAGTANLSGITVDSATGGNSTSELVVSGGTLYLGGTTGAVVGLTLNSPGATDFIHFGTATVGALGPWTTTAAIALTGTTTFRTANAAGTANNITLGGVLSGAGFGLTETGTGTLTLGAINTYTGATLVSAGTLKLGSAGGIGSGASNTSGVTVSSGASLDLGGFTPSATVGLSLNGAGAAGVGALTNSGGAASYPGAVTLTGTTTFGGSGNITLPNSISGAFPIIYNGTGTLILSGAANASTTTTINAGGTVEIGAGAASGFLGSGAVTDNGTLIFNRPGNYGGTLSNVIGGTGGVTVNSGQLTLSGASNYSGSTTISSGTTTLTSSAALGNTAIAVANGASFVVQSGSGNFQIGTTAASLTLGGNSSFSMSDGSIGTVTLNAPGSGFATVLTLNGTTLNPANLTFDVGGAAGADELIANNGLVVFAGSGQENIFLTPGGIGSPSTITGIPLISAPDSVITLGDFNLKTSSITISGIVYSTSLALGAGNTELVLNLTPTGSSNFYFTGAQSASWSTPGNFTTDNTGGTLQNGTFGTSANVFLTADTASTFGNYQTETVDGNYTISSLSFTGTDAAVGNTPAATSPIVLTGGSATALTLAATSSFVDSNGNAYAVGTGLVDQAGTAGHTISVNINLGNSQTWEIDGTSVLTMTGVIGDGSTLDALTKTGAGELLLENAETYDGGTIVNSGTLYLGTNGITTGSLAPTGSLTVSGSGTLDLAGNSQTVGGLNGSSGNAAVTTSQPGAVTLTVNNGTPSSYAGAINDTNALNGSILSLVLSGTSSVTLSGSSNFTGGTTLNSGNLTVAGNYSLGNPLSASSNAGLVLMPATSGTVNASFTSPNPTIASLTNPGSGVSNVILGNPSGSGSATTLHIGDVTGGGAAESLSGATFSGVISNASATAIGSLDVNSGAALILTNSNTFSGQVTITGSGLAGASVLELGNSLAIENATLNYNNQGGIINFGSLAAVTFGGLTGSENLPLGAMNVTIGNDNISSSYAGSLSGGGTLIKVGTGTFTLTGVNTFTGTTTLDAGLLAVTSGSYGSSGASITVAAGGTLLQVSGGTVVGSTLAVGLVGGQTGAAASITGSGSAFFGSVQLGNAANTAGNLTINTTGTVGLGTYLLGRDSTVATSTTSSGLIIEAGTVTANTIGGGSGVAGRGTDINIQGGSLTVGTTGTTGAFELGNANVGNAFLTMTGGLLTYAGTDGLIVTEPNTTNVNAEGVTITGGTATLTGITLNPINSATTTITLTVGGGATLYLGNVGLVVDHPAGSIVTANLGTATVGANAAWTSSAPITLTGTTTFQTASASGTANNITLTGVLSGTGGLNKTFNGGTLTLTGANTYSGLTIITSGILNINGVGALGGANYGGLIFSGGTLQYAAGFTGNGSGDITQATGGAAKTVTLGAGGATIDTDGNNVIYGNSFGGGGSGGLTLIDTLGGGSLTLEGTGSYTGATTITPGAILQLGSGASGQDGTIATSSGIADNGTLIYDRFGAPSSGAPISGTGSVIVSGPGSQTLTGSNSFSGSVTINSAATLQLGNGAAGNDGTLLSVPGILDNGTLIYNRSGALVSGVVISGAGNVQVSGSGSQTLIGVNTYTGVTTINPGATLQLGDGTSGDDGTISNSSAGITDNGTLIYNRSAARTAKHRHQRHRPAHRLGHRVGDAHGRKHLLRLDHHQSRRHPATRRRHNRRQRQHRGQQRHYRQRPAGFQSVRLGPLRRGDRRHRRGHRVRPRHPDPLRGQHLHRADHHQQRLGVEPEQRRARQYHGHHQ